MAEFTFTDQNFEEEVLKSSIPVFVDFWAVWCVDPETQIQLTNNFSLSAGNIRQGMSILGWDQGISNGQVSYSRTVSDGGHCRLIRTTTGREIKVTDDHLFYTSSGWKKAEELGISEKVAVLPLDEPIRFEMRDNLLLDENDVMNFVSSRMRVSFYLKELSKMGLLPLYESNPKMLILARLMGALITDGSLYEGKNNYREASFCLGTEDDAKAVVEDLATLGFTKTQVKYRQTQGMIGVRKFINSSFRVKVSSTSFWLLMRALGVPAGNKTKKGYFLPKWLMSAQLAVKKEFLAAYMGGDGPKIGIHLVKRAKKNPYNSLVLNDLEFHKNKNVAKDGIVLANQLKILFEEFGVSIKKVFVEEEKDIRKDGSRSMVVHLGFAHDFNTGLALAQNIGYRYCRSKQLSAIHTGEFLRLVQQKKKEWRELYQRALIEAKNGLGYRRISKKLKIPPLLAFNWIKGRDKATSPKHFLKFPDWLTQATEGLKDGFVWESIENVQPVYLPSVARITVEKTHNFIANGFLVHNCGPCLMAGPVIEELAKEYAGRVKIGKLNVDENPQMSEKYGIMSIPTVILFKNGIEIKRQVGFPGKEGYMRLIDS